MIVPATSAIASTEVNA